MLHASYDHSKQSSDQSLPRLCLSTIDGNNSEVEMFLLIKETKSQKVFSISSFRDFFAFMYLRLQEINFQFLKTYSPHYTHFGF